MFKVKMLPDFEMLMPDEAFSKTHDMNRVIELGLIYLNALLPDPKTGLAPYELGTIDLSPELNSFIAANKEKTFTNKIYGMDRELYRAAKLQKIVNDYMLNKNTKEGRRARLLEKNMDKLSVRIPKIPNHDEEEIPAPKVISKNLETIDAISLLAVIKSLRENDFSKKVNGIELVVTGSIDGLDINPLPLQFYRYTDDPVKISINLCMIHFSKKEISVTFENEFRMNLFYSLLQAPVDLDILAETILPILSKMKSPHNKSKGKKKKGKNTGAPNILQLRVSIKGISPPIWRKLLVNSDTTLHDLHLMIQAAFGWYNYHLYEFSYGYRHYSRPDDWDEMGTEEIDATKIALADLNLNERDWLNYVYDFGDYWEHKVLVQKILTPDPSIRLPACIGGRRSGPPEDCGGTYGYYDVLEKARDPNDPEHKDTVRWLGNYDPEEFDLQSVDARVKKYNDMEARF